MKTPMKLEEALKKEIPIIELHNEVEIKDNRPSRKPSIQLNEQGEPILTQDGYEVITEDFNYWCSQEYYEKNKESID